MVRVHLQGPGVGFAGRAQLLLAVIGQAQDIMDQVVLLLGVFFQELRHDGRGHGRIVLFRKGHIGLVQGFLLKLGVLGPLVFLRSRGDPGPAKQGEPKHKGPQGRL